MSATTEQRAFKPAQRHSVKARIAIYGPSKSGKTYTALAIATGLGDRIAVIDAENGSASLYAGDFAFDTAGMYPPFHPGRYAQGIQMAVKEGYDVIIVDGISPAWNGPGGVLEIVEKNTKGANKFSGWAVGTPAHQELLDAILSCRAHLICTMRSATEYTVDEKGKPHKVGLKPVQRDGIEYEFHFLCELDVDHAMRVEARGEFAGRIVEPSGVAGASATEFGRQIAAWLSAGEDGDDASAQPVSPDEAARDLEMFS